MYLCSMAKKLFSIFIFTLFCSAITVAQKIPVGSWFSMNSFNSQTSIAVAGTNVYAGKYGILQYNIANNEYSTYSKVNGLSDVGITHLAYEKGSNCLVITYENSNVDILQNGVFYNLPDIKNLNVIASKKINSINFINGNAYLSTGLGIIVLDLNKKEVKATYPMLIGGTQSEVKYVDAIGDSIVSLTSLGIYKAALSNTNLENIAFWTLKDAGVYNKLINVNDTLFLVNNTQIKRWDNGSAFTTIYTTPLLPITDVIYANSIFNISSFDPSQYGSFTKINTNGTLINATNGFSSNQLAADASNTIWAADEFNGLITIDNNNQQIKHTVAGPYSINAYTLKAYDNLEVIID